MAIFNIMLIGKTGHGKSSTANTLVGREVFEVSGSSSSTTKDNQYETTTIDGHDITVIDTPGMKDTENKKSNDTSKAIDYMTRALMQCDSKIHLFLFVFKYGAKFTQEEMDSIRTFYPGEDNKEEFLRRCAVLVTNGDDFLLDNKEESFNTWCRQQKEMMGFVLKDVDYRAILFENKRRPLPNQKSKVIQMAINICADHGPYTKAMFEKAVDEYESMSEKCC